MNDNRIDISGLDKAEVLVALWEAATFSINRYASIHMAVSAARDILDSRSHVSWLWGKPIGIDFSKDSISINIYNLDNGKGLAEKVINNLRKSKQ